MRRRCFACCLPCRGELGRRQSVMPPAAISIPRRQKEPAPGGYSPPAVGGALSAAVYDWILRCCWFYVSTDSVCFSRFATCCPASVLAGLQSAMLCVTAFLQSADCRRGRSSAPGSRNHRATLYCRQAAILCNRSTEIRFGGSAPLHRCPSLHSGHRPLTAADG